MRELCDYAIFFIYLKQDNIHKRHIHYLLFITQSFQSVCNYSSIWGETIQLLKELKDRKNFIISANNLSHALITLTNVSVRSVRQSFSNHDPGEMYHIPSRAIHGPIILPSLLSGRPI